MTNKLKFKYFEGPEEDMGGLCKVPVKCALCGRNDVCFELEFVDCPELDENQREGKVGCVECLKEGRFGFLHGTDVGIDDFSTEVLAEFRRTPEIVTWQQEVWLTHCNDFMSYQGTWGPEDFYKNASSGNGRAVFMKMTDEYQNLWDDSLPEGETKLKQWHATYYVFKCLHCGKLKGYWDCD